MSETMAVVVGSLISTLIGFCGGFSVGMWAMKKTIARIDRLFEEARDV
jgi:hypothetical protein